ncbi:MAG TPA: TetR/AcrR family transcriptional regulator [Pirellulales bacterium]|jgi:AcrR family transcriptional regulator|nr:TetR/AcrR family transcriptional regulator [Pirellulales bacterium]
MKARSARGAETKLRILGAAADLFHKQGVHATSPEQIIEASETGKGQFYHYFKNKEGLIHEVLLHYLEAIESGSAPINYDIESWQDLEHWFVAHIEAQKRFGMKRGCPFGTIGNEVTENDELIRADMSLLFEVVKNKLVAFFSREKAAGRLTAEANVQPMAELCLAAIQGAMLLGKIRRSAQPVEAAVQEVLAHLRGYVVSAPS